MRCVGELFIVGGTEEYAEPEWSYVVRAQCNAGKTGDCGFDIVISELAQLEGDAWSLTSADVALLQERHLAHSSGARPT